MKEYDLFIPLCYNDGTSIEARKLQRLHSQLLEQFDRLTFFPQPNEGYWRIGGVTFRDDIVIYRVLTDKVRSARKFLTALKISLMRDLRQEEILIVERDAERL